MPLHCTLVRSPCAALQAIPLELTIDGPQGASGAELQAELTRRFGTGRVSVDGQDVSSLALGQPPLVTGSVLVDGAMREPGLRPGQCSSQPPAALALAVHSGAGAGTVVPLRRGTYTIGRSQGEIRIPDADLSRTHARLVVTETAISIIDLDSANGTEVDGQRVRNAVVSAGSTIRCGSSTMSLVFTDRSAHSLDQAGNAAHEPLVVVRTDAAANRAGLLLGAVLPLVIGVGLAVITGMWMFLAFTAVSAVSVLVPLVTGRRQRRDLAAAVRAAVATDQERRRRAAPPLSVLVLRGAAVREQTQTAEPAQGIWLRLGQAVQPANLRFEPADPARAAPSAGMLPLTLDPGRPLTTIRGPQALVDGLMRSVLMQLAGYPAATGTRVVVHGRVERLPLAARYPGNCTLSADTASLDSILERGSAPARGILILLEDTGSNEAITAKAQRLAWQVLRFCRAATAPVPADVELGERTSVFHDGDESVRFAPDLVQSEVFNRFCRQLAQDATLPGMTGHIVPLTCRLDELLPLSSEDISRAWSASRVRAGLAVPLGRALAGPRLLDLQSDGPHLLVAGTTGSGKSELLRSLTIALAASYPPDRINFLFVDFKGGSGLGPLSGLPHCVGMLTDLTSHELERSLQSLRAEIMLREQALAAVQAQDLASYRTTPEAIGFPLPHLVIVIDEFRMLVEDAPEALSELMRIASVGRSLGIHLVMATQRPQGALTADIRANVTTSIALRVQSEMESLDIINSKAAAGISVDTPGRAYLARGTQAPEEFQAGSLAQASCGSEPTGVSVRLASDYISQPVVPAGIGPEDNEIAARTASAPLVAAVSASWESTDSKPVRRPVAEPLPCLMPEPACSGAGTGGWSVRFGGMDLPFEQKTAPLIWEPAEHGHLGLIGGPKSGVPEAMRLAVLRLAGHTRESHLYVLDPDSSFKDLASHHRVGAHTGLHELRRSVRVLERLAQELSRRLGRPADDGETPLVLAIAGWGSWVSAFRAGPLGWAEELVHGLVRDGSRAGITVIISGERELVTARFFASVPNRIYFPTGSSEDSRIAWPKLPPTPSAVGRCVALGAISAGRTAVCQFYTALRPEVQAGRAGLPPKSLRSQPFHVDPLPSMVPAAQLLDIAAAASVPGHRLLRIGVGGDELAAVSVRVPSGGVLAVLGGPASGKSSMLRLLPWLNPHSGPWLQPASDADPAVFWTSILGRATAGELDRGSVALIDDADLLPQESVASLAGLNALGVTVVMTAGFSPVLAQRVPLVLRARSLGSGVLIAPRTLMDGDLFGVRFETEEDPPPGRAVVIGDNRPMAVQLGWLPPDDVHGSVPPNPSGS